MEKNEDIQDGYSHWLCQCDCGNKRVVKGVLLTSGGVKSCGCLHSIEESNLSQFFTTKGIAFEREKSFDTCIFPDTHRKAKFDFYLPQYNALIEYDGEQHFQCRGNGWNTKEHLEKTQKRDVFKSNWAEKNNIPLLRISYKEKKH